MEEEEQEEERDEDEKEVRRKRRRRASLLRVLMTGVAALAAGAQGSLGTSGGAQPLSLSASQPISLGLHLTLPASIPVLRSWNTPEPILISVTKWQTGLLHETISQQP